MAMIHKSVILNIELAKHNLSCLCLLCNTLDSKMAMVETDSVSIFAEGTFEEQVASASRNDLFCKTDVHFCPRSRN